ncbi:hypothetical protein U1Q18_052721 [Sarracenia purpurea var. burkii]
MAFVQLRLRFLKIGGKKVREREKSGEEKKLRKRLEWKRRRYRLTTDTSSEIPCAIDERRRTERDDKAEEKGTAVPFCQHRWSSEFDSSYSRSQLDLRLQQCQRDLG